MSEGQRRLRQDLTLSAILFFLLILGLLYRLSPMDFMNPGFPSLKRGELRLSEQFRVVGTWYPSPRRMTDLYDQHEIAYEMVFTLEDTSQIFPDSQGIMRPTAFGAFQSVTRYPDSTAARQELNQRFNIYNQEEGDFPLRIADIPMEDFVSQADQHLLWCAQYSHETIYDSEEVQTCYYWAVYDNYLSQIKMNMWPIVGGGRQYSLKLFGEVISRAEEKFLPMSIFR